MKSDRSITGTLATLQDVLDRLAVAEGLTDARRRDLRSAVRGYAKIVGMTPAAIPLDLAAIRERLDAMVPAEAKVSAKRWANRRSDLAAAFAACGLMPILKTAKVKPDPTWTAVLAPVADPAIRNGLSRFSRWASLRGIAPTTVDAAVVERFVAELEAASLVRHVREQFGSVAKAWNALIALTAGEGLRPVALPERRAPVRVPWEQVPESLRNDLEHYLAWCAAPDAFDPDARARALAPLTLRLRRNHIHSAVQAARTAGVPREQLGSLANLVQPEVVRSLLRQCRKADGDQLSAYTHGLAGTLITAAVEWVKAPAAQITDLKKLRAKLGSLPSGLTEKNKSFVRKFDDPALLRKLLDLPDRLWRKARRDLQTSRRPFIDLQTSLAIEILLHVPVRMENLASIKFGEHLQWPQGRGKPALMIFRIEETKNEEPLEFELPATLSERLYIYRNEIAPAITGEVPAALFVAWTGKHRTQAAVALAIKKALRRHLGLAGTPHQFRHLAAKIELDGETGNYEQVRQMLGHRNMRTTTAFYAGIDTRRAGRAHAELLLKLREESLCRGRRSIPRKPKRD